MKKETRNEILAALLVGVVVFTPTFYLISKVKWNVNGSSMTPTLHDQQVVWISPFATPERSDIIIFRSPIDENKYLIKRIIAIAGDTIALNSYSVFLNGVELNEKYIVPLECPIVDVKSVTVPEGYVFVLGDNRPNSIDSRFFGFVSIEAIQGVFFW